MFRDVIQKFAEQAPATLMIEALLERLLEAEALDRWFEEVRGEQALFSFCVALVAFNLYAVVLAALRAAPHHGDCSRGLRLLSR